MHQGGHRHGHGQVGFAGARRADAEDDVVGPDGFDIALLVEALGGDAPLHGGDVDRVQEDILDRGALIVLENLDGVLHVLGQDRIACLQEAVEFLEHPLGQTHLGLRPLQGHLVAPHVVLHPQAAADDGQVLAVLAVESLGQGIVLKGELGACHRERFCRRRFTRLRAWIL